MGGFWKKGGKFLLVCGWPPLTQSREVVMLQPENQAKKYDHLFSDIDQGLIKVPKFQRDFVWGKVQTASLVDSIIKGFPIGTFIFWKTKEELRHFKDIGNFKLPDIKKGEPVCYVLDGQQRITSLYAVRKGIVFDKEGERIDYKDVCIDLSRNPDDDQDIVLAEPSEGTASISVHRLLNEDFTELMQSYSPEQLKKIELFKKRLTTYDFSTILITEYPLDVACEIFTRINTEGTELTLFEIMVAKTYDSRKNFDLADQYDKLLDSKNKEKDLRTADYETISPQAILQCISVQICNQCRRTDILKLDKRRFIREWPIVKEGIFAAIDYFRNHLRITASKLLPYNALIVPFAYFFIHNMHTKPTKIQNTLLTQYFWWASLSGRFSSAQESKIALDIKRMDRILAEKAPSYRGEEVSLDLEELKWRGFTTGDAFCKAILCLLASFEPKAFDSNSVVRLDNSWLTMANSKNYHHFFPKSYLERKKGVEAWKANSVVNITLVDDYLNKQVIGARAPSKYLTEFRHGNAHFSKTMQSHLISPDKDGVWNDDYERFISRRAARILKAINSRLYPET
jgi:hypothetical protein